MSAAATATAEPFAPPPWHVRGQATLWWHRAGQRAAEAVPAALRGRRRLPVCVCALVRYAESPVGAYDELLASPALLLDGARPRGHVALMAVDSPASLRAGREHWALPKVEARFAWSGAAEPAGVTVRPATGAWALEAHVRARGPRLPLALAGRCLQVRGGEVIGFGVRGGGLARAARVRVDFTGAEPPPWLVPGDHPALVLERARVRVGSAAPAARVAAARAS